jgi:iron complex outermembrane receptor protein
MTRLNVTRTLVSTIACAGAGMLMLAFAAQPAAAQDSGANQQGIEEIIVTGSRIRRSVADSIAPITTLGGEAFGERGYISAAEALNEVTSINPQLNQAAGDGTSSGPGQQFPELFGLGTGRTLSLVNSRRFVTSSNGLGDAQVDSNIIPTGLIDRIEIVQAGAAAVYGSDAIAGVINYILKDDFEGLELDAQYGQSSYDDYEQENFRLTYGLNFADGRGNVAVNAEYSSTPSLAFSDRPLTNLARVTWANPDDTGPNDGIPSLMEVFDTRFYAFNGDGVIFTIPAPVPLPPCGFDYCFLRINGEPTTFDSSGNVVAYDPGSIFFPPPFAEGGDGFRYSELAGLRTAVDRVAVNAISRYDISDRLTFRAELLYAETEGDEVPQGFPRTVLSPAPNDAIIFFANNPFLTPEALAALTVASPAFAGGAPLFLSRHFYYDLLPSNVATTTTSTSRLALGLEGDFDTGARDFYWTLSGSFGRVDGENRGWEVHNTNFQNAVFLPLPDGAGGAVCFINVDGDPTNDDPTCAPVNPFGQGNVSDAARNYTTVMAGTDYRNEQIDILATIGTSLFSLPAGDVEAVFAYERRDEQVDFIPLPANQQGLFGTGAPELPQSGDYDTNEFSVEVLVPLIGGDKTFAMTKGLEFSGTYRYVDNSIAGSEDVWSAGLNWRVVDDLILRVSQSRNFRAPTLTQLVAPTSVSITQAGDDPCDADRINSGPNPSVRRSNCEAEWAANPQYGPLDTFQSGSENFAVAEVTSGGNPNLRNEVSDTTTYGLILQPRFAPGLTFSVDRIEIELTDGLSAFTPEDFAATCYDNTPQPADACSTFTRLAADDGTNPAGTIIEALSTTFNAGIIEYKGYYYYLNYDLPMSDWFGGGNPGELSFSIEATNTALLTTSVTGSTFERTDNTVAQPDWVTKFNAHYSRGPLRLTYQLYNLSAVLAASDATVENNPNPFIDSNMTHSISGQYDIGNFTIRAGVINLTDEEPSYPNFVHGDILGRRYFVGVTANLF